MPSTSTSFASTPRSRIAQVLAVALVALGLSTATTAPAAADANPITVSMTAAPAPVASGGQLTYTIDVVNTGGARADEVVLTDQINGLTGLILTSDVGSCSQSANLVTCDAGTLDGFQSWRVTIRGTVTGADGDSLNNTATVSGTRSSTTFTVTATTSTLVSNASTGPLPDLTLSVQGPATIGDGENATWNLTVNNIGNAKASEITVYDTLPLGFTYLSSSGTSLFSCSNPGGLTVVCTGGAVNAGANATITITAKAGSGADPLKNTAVVDPFDEIDEVDENNNTGSLVSAEKPTPAQTNLTITKTDSPDPLRVGDILTYTIKVVNTAATRADSVSITDGTTGLDQASIVATTDRGSCTVAASKVTCTRKSPTLRLNPGETMNVTITGKVVNTAGSLITNTATVTGNIKNKGTSNTATTTTTVRPGVDLTVVQHSVVSHSDAPAPDAFRARDRFNYEITVGNSGLDDAVDVVVREPLPTGMVYNGVVSAPAGVVCGASNGVLSCTNLLVKGVISSGQVWGTTERIVVSVIAPPAIGAITATVTVDPTNAIYESDERNNTGTTTTWIDTGIDLTLTKDSEAKVATSGTLVYTIVVSNIGTQDTTGVVVRDPLPAGTRFRAVADTSNHNFTCSHNGAATGGVVECVGGILRGTYNHTLPVDSATITITLFAPPNPVLIRNQVRVDPDGAIPEIFEDNNIASVNTDIAIWTPGDPVPPGACCAYNELTIDKTQKTPPANKVAPSGQLVYDLTVKNWGSDAAFGVVVQDQIASGAIFRYARDAAGPGPGAFTCAASGSVVTCTGGTLDGTSNQTPTAGDDTRTIEVGLFAPTQPGTYTNQAEIDPLNAIPEANETNNSDSETTTVLLGGGGNYIDLTVASAQSSPAGAVVPSGMLQYQLTVSNLGTAVSFNTTVRDTLPTGTVFRSAKDTTGISAGAFTCSESGGVVTCTGGTLDGSNGDTPALTDTSRTITIDLFAPTQPGTYTNQAQVDPLNAIAENDETNNTDQTDTTVALSGGGDYIDLSVPSITTNLSGDPTPGQAYTYTVTVKNTGTDVAFNTTVRTVLDPALTFVSATGTNDLVCDEASGVITCTGGSIDGTLDQDPSNGDTATLTIKVKAPLLHDYAYSVTTRVDPGNLIPEANEANNARSLELTVTSKVDLTVSVGSPSLTSGSEGDWTFTASNSGTSPVRGVTVVFNLAVGTIPLNVSADDTGWSCQITENPISQVTCTGDLNDASTTFTVHLYVTAQGETITSNAVIDPADVIVESDETNNTGSGSSSV